MKFKIGIYATTNLKYAKPGNTVAIETSKIWDFEDPVVGKIVTDDYDGCRMLLDIIEVEVNAEQYYGMLVDEIVPEAFKQKETKLRADFQKALTENQALLQQFLAIPNGIKESNDDDLPF